MFEIILLPLDPIAPERRVFEEAIALAKATKAKLKLLGVLSGEGEGSLLMSKPEAPNYDHSLNDWNLFQERYQAYKEKALSTMQALVEEATAGGVKADLTQLSGKTGRVICDFSAETAANLIVIGSHGRTGLDEILLGSVSNYVVHHAPCSVMVVHLKKGAATAEQNTPAQEAHLAV